VAIAGDERGAKKFLEEDVNQSNQSWWISCLFSRSGNWHSTIGWCRSSFR
jgi:hypothetical protein